MMNNKFRISSLLVILFLAFGISSCKKDNPVPEINQEDFDKTVLTFIEVQENGGQFNELDTALSITFDASGKPDKSHYHLQAGRKYRLYIKLHSDGDLINDEIMEEASSHQFFFTGAPEGVLNYTYEDNIGLKGILEVVKENATFDFNIVLRHGIRKTNPVLPWNTIRSEYTKHGGSDDLNVTFKLHPTAGDSHDDH